MEINFNHGEPLELADQAFLFKRTVRQAALRRRGYIFAALLASPTREGAERAYFGGEGLRPPLPRAMPGAQPADSEVIGLFPHAGDLA